MDLQIAGDVAVVIGAASGIGRAIAEGFAAESAAVALLDRDPQVVDVAAGIRQQCGTATVAVVADVCELELLRQGADRVCCELGEPRHVVHAAAVGSGKYGFPFWNLTPSDWSRVLEVNLLGAVNVAHVFVPYLVQARCGTVLFLASVAGQIGSQTDPPYSASKAGVINFAQCCAKDLAPHGVRVNTLCPGMVRTPLNESVWKAWHDQQDPAAGPLDYEGWAGRKISQVVPLGRWQEPRDIADMAVFLASPRARNVTGQTINVDGGFVMHW